MIFRRISVLEKCVSAAHPLYRHCKRPIYEATKRTTQPREGSREHRFKGRYRTAPSPRVTLHPSGFNAIQTHVAPSGSFARAQSPLAPP
jgi:hypothetical protein